MPTTLIATIVSDKFNDNETGRRSHSTKIKENTSKCGLTWSNLKTVILPIFRYMWYEINDHSFNFNDAQIIVKPLHVMISIILF